ncbi:SDR family NAD(P)-dependent oxidoreductase [Streptomyces buecherae]|uniref:SDR family NAD(P)-dependent oxidoreductase n=1 Tax=Streptomyces buecherae TaxID=2763006 RepID=UPI00164D9B8B|nr:SDR family NAD(P)-dependent oxidoreductase [Streptomyces buecherae]QNJ43592.1 SDR family NAD(P)-dependent oxidoreductase [Streptomyces buecherae]
MNRQEILAALREKRLTPDEARKLLQAGAGATAATTAASTPVRPAGHPTPEPATPPATKPTGAPAGGSATASASAPASAPAAGSDGRPSPIAVVGMSGRYATAENLDQYWQLLDQGQDAVREIPPHRWDMERYYDPTVGKEGSIYCRWMGLLDDIDAFDSFFFEISPSEAEMMDPQHRIFLEEAYRAFEDAGYSRQRLDGSNCGVYLGLASSDYYTLAHEALQEGDELPSVTSVSNAIAAGRLAYFLNLKGPALTVDTACSSSLVSVHLGVQALQRGEIDMALAGGASLYLSPDSYMHMCSAGMLSPDGRCKTFDNGADGFVPGEGAGAVVLKRLADAERDGDQIYGVITASGINQDGRTNGITAPNLGSQIELVKAAYERHGIDPATISYAELHGTGTKLGDPIELEALAAAFRTWTDQRNFCAIGSVKSNVGHMSAAAGVAGLHKILLSLRHAKLAPTLHVNSPNEHFDFERSPFVLTTEGRPWQPAPGAPRRACLSAFGFSGTNAHVVVDEYVPTAARPAPRRAGDREHTFVLSAKAEPQLRDVARRLADHLTAHPETHLDDVAYTLQTGREPMRERLAITARDRETLLAALDAFARHGESLPGVRRGRVAKRPTGRDWVEGGPADWSGEWAGLSPRRVPLPTYPFEKSRHWYPQSAAEPGERAAGDAEGPGRASAPHPLVHENVSDFTRQRFRSHFTGQEFFLADHRVDGTPVLPGAAVVEMARAAGELSAGQPVTEVSEVVWARPVIDQRVEVALFPTAGTEAGFEVHDGHGTVCASGQLGFEPVTPPPPLDLAALRARCATRLGHADLYPEQGTSADEPGSGVFYGPAFRTLRELAYGPTDALATLELDTDRPGFALHPALLDGAWQAIRPFLATDGAVYLPFAVDRLRCFAPLPSPAHAHVRPAGADAPGSRAFDVTITDAHGAVAAEVTGFTVRAVGRPEAPEPVFLTQRWQEAPARQHGTADRARTLVLFTGADATTTGPLAGIATLADLADVVAVAGTGFAADDAGTRFTLPPTERDDHALLLDALRRHDRLPDRIVLVAAEPAEGPYAVHALAGALATAGPRWQVDLVYAYPVPGDRPHPEHRAVGGYLRSLLKEDRFVTARAVGLAPDGDPVDRLRRELAADPADAVDLWWDGATRRALRTAEVATGAEGAPAFRTGGVYLITGGLGGVGLAVARHLSRAYDARLVLTGRRELEPDAELPGAHTLYVPADVSRRADVEALVARAKERFGRIDGVLHSAGTLRDALIRNKSAADVAAVLAPKVAGTRHLDEVLRDEPLDLFALFSSMSAVLGNLGQSDYCFASAYQDAFAAEREELRRQGLRSGRTVSIGWPFWADGGMAIQPEAARALRDQLGIAPLASDEGCRALERALRLPEPHVVYASGDAAAIRRTFGIEPPAEPQADDPAATEAPASASSASAPAASSAPTAELRRQAVGYLTRIISERIKSDPDKIDAADDFEVFGIDSIVMISLTRRMEEDFGELPKTLFFEYGSIEELADHFVADRAADLQRLFGAPEPAPEAEPGAAVAETERRPATPEPVAAQHAAPRFRATAATATSPRVEPAPAGAQDIAVIGVDGRYPGADDLRELWANLASGTDSVTEVPADRWDHTQYFAPEGRTPGKAYAKWGGFLDGVDQFDPLFFNISPGEADFLDPQARLFLQTAWRAVEDAGYTRTALADQTVGVYVGVMYGMYELFQGEIKGEPVPVPSSFAAIANRVSYFMNLHGPSMAVDTMCSSSLTTIHLGCESIRRGESDVVIAGGVNLTIHPNKLILLSQGNFAATDGRCRSFGEGGDGYVPGEGVGAVVLKSLERAVADGDHVYGVIKGSAINAGGKTSGFTVPNPNAQADLIRTGLADAGVDARTVSYIEAHGTGTSLGDPIEITALTNAFRQHTDDTGFCAIGSLKSNIGHLESAAGIGALTKVLLQLKHRQLAPSLHSTTLNPYIDFARSPFVVQQELAPWQAPAGQPLRAGISSFGAGGANAHLIVEEYVERRPRPAKAAGPHLFVYSARDEERLRELVAHHLAAARDGFDGADLASVAHTLQVGREAMEQRLAVVADDLAELTSALAAYLAGDAGAARVHTGNSRGAGRQSKLLVGLFEDSDMMSGLLRDRRLDKVAELWVEGIAMDWWLLYDRPPRRVPLPGYAFARERCWVTGPATPRPATGAEQLHPLLHRNSSNLEGLRFSSTFTGREFFLTDHRVGGQKLLPAVAYLEMALTAVRAALPEQARDAELRVRDVVWLRPCAVADEPRTVHVSLTPGQGADAIAFRVHGDDTHCQGEVELATPAATPAETLDLAALRARCTRPSVEGAWAYETFTRMGIAYGPAHQAIQTVYRGTDEALVALRLPAGVTADAGRYTLHPALLDAALQATLALSLPDAPEDPAALPRAEGKSAELPFAVRSVAVAGATSPVMWAHLRPARGAGGGDRLKKIDITLCDDAGRVAVRLDQVAFKSYAFDAGAGAAAPTERLLFAPRWQAAPRPAPTAAAHLDRWTVLVCEPAAGLLDELAALLPEADVRALASAATRPADRYQDHVVDLLGHTARLLHDTRKQSLLVQVVAADDASYGLAGFLQSLRGEHPAASAQLVRCQDAPRPAELAERLRAERAWPADQVVRYVDGRRETRQWAELPAPAGERAPLWRDGGVYLVTGGAGGLGLLMADEIARSVRAPHLILTGRSAPSARTEAALEQLRAHGAVAAYAQADVTDPAACRALVARVAVEHGGPHGVLHCAGVTRDRLITGKTAEDARAVLAPKTAGLIALDEATAHLPLDFCWLFSSAAGALGNAGQADYAAGNAFMDHYAAHRNALVARGERAGRTLSVNWQLWQDGGMGLSAEQARAATEAAGLAVLDRATGLEVLAACVATGEDQVLPLVGDATKLRAYLRAQTGNAPQAPATAATPATAAPATATPATAVAPGRPSADAEELTDLLAVALKGIVAEEIKLDAARVDVHVPLENYGIDSVLIINLTQQLEEHFGPLPKTIFFENQTVMELAEALCQSHPRQAAELAGPRTPAPAPAAQAAQAAEPTAERAPVALPANWSRAFTGPATASAPPAPEAGGGLDIAIVGLAGRYAQADDMAQFWTNLRSGRDSVTEIPADRWDHTPYLTAGTSRQERTYARWGGFVDEAASFDSLFFNISPGEAEVMDPQERIFLECVHHALEDAGYSRRSLTGQAVGVYVGVMYEEYQLYAAQQQVRGEMVTLTGSAASIANRVSYQYGFHGPSLAVDTMCSSSLVAIHLAAQSLLSGECEAAVAGGVNLSLHPNKFLMLGKNHFASTRGRCESFGSGGDGYVPGEGVGAVLLKPLARAEADGDHVYGVIKGTAVSHDGKTNGYTVPNPHAQTAVIRRALDRAGVEPRRVSYVEAHGTGTRLGDPIEVSALTKAFGSEATEARRCYLGSVKSNIGHCESAAGIAGISKVLLQMRHGEIAPSLHSTALNPEIDFAATPFTVPQEVTAWEALDGPRIAGISSFGAGGTNAHVVIAEYQPPAAPTASDDAAGPVLVRLTARRADQLRSLAQRLLDWLRERRLSAAELADVAYTLQVGRDAYEERVGFVVSQQADLEAGLADFVAGRPAPYQGTVTTPVPPPRGPAADELRARYAAGDHGALLDLWVGGQDLDWEAFTAPGTRRRVSLPTYPFARLRHWLPPRDTAAPLAAPAPAPAAPPSGRVAPLLHHNRSSLFEQRFTTTFTGREPFLDGHRVSGRKVLPGAVTLEMARLAGALSLEQEVRSVRDVMWRHPIEVGEEPVEVTVRLVPEEESVLVRVGLDEGPPAARVCMEARIDLGTEPAAPPGGAPPLDLSGVIARCESKLDGSAGYAAMAAAGLDNGPGFQVIEEVLYGDGHAVAQLALPPAADRDPADVLHPALVNGAFQAVIALMAEPAGQPRANRLLLPFSVAAIDIRGPLPEECVAHLRRAGDATPGGSVDRFDITLTDLTGKALVVVKDYALKSFPTGAETGE